MQGDHVFTEQEYATRLAAVRAAMAGQNLDLALICTPENIYYLIGLDHWGYFVPNIIILPRDGEPTLLTREDAAWPHPPSRRRRERPMRWVPPHRSPPLHYLSRMLESPPGRPLIQLGCIGDGRLTTRRRRGQSM